MPNPTDTANSPDAAHRADAAGGPQAAVLNEPPDAAPPHGPASTKPGRRAEAGSAAAGAARGEALIRDIIEGRRDLGELAQAHGLSLIDLADWADDADNRGRLAALCVLADAQVQLFISRHRMLAATRLLELVTQQLPEGASGETARRAAADLMKMELKRFPDAPPGAGRGAGATDRDQAGNGAGDGADAESGINGQDGGGWDHRRPLRDLLYAALDHDPPGQ